MIKRITLLCILLWAANPIAQTAVTITPGQDPVSIIAAGPGGRAYTFTCGDYRVTQPILPKSGDTLTAATPLCARISGAVVLTDWSQSGTTWSVSESRRNGNFDRSSGGNCDGGYPRCHFPEDIFIDGVVLKHVDSVGGVNATSFFYDYNANRIYIGVNPAGKVVELSIADKLIGGGAINVTVSNLIVEKCASRLQQACLDPGGSDWKILGNTIRYAHARGMNLNSRAVVRNNRIIDNGQMGIGGGGVGALVENNIIANNRKKNVGVQIGWEAGGTKFAFSTDLVVRRNLVYGNDGPALWTDINNRNTLYEDNVVYNNTWVAIMHEISMKAVIRNNKIYNNGHGHPQGEYWPSVWVPQQGILVSASSNVEVYGNILIDNSDCIGAIQQNRSADEPYYGVPAGTYRLRGLNVHDNICVQTAGSPSNGMAADFYQNLVFTRTGSYNDGPAEVLQPAGTGYNNRWSGNNKYFWLTGTSGGGDFAWNGDRNFASWQALGFDTAANAMVPASTFVATADPPAGPTTGGEIPAEEIPPVKPTLTTNRLSIFPVGTTVTTVRPMATVEVAAACNQTAVTGALTLGVSQNILPRTGWRIQGVSSEETVGETAPASAAIDGKVETFWHTRWLPPNGAVQPHSITLDLGSTRTVSGIRVTPRQTGENGRIAGYQVFVSDSVSNWGAMVIGGTWVNTTTPQDARFAAKAGRYIQLRTTSEVNGGPWATIAEFDVMVPSTADFLITPTPASVVVQWDDPAASGKFCVSANVAAELSTAMLGRAAGLYPIAVQTIVVGPMSPLATTRLRK